MDVAAAIFDAIPSRSPDRVAWGRVAVVSPLQVTFAGDSASVRVESRAASYVPTVGDTVVLLRVGARWVAFAKLEVA